MAAEPAEPPERPPAPYRLELGLPAAAAVRLLRHPAIAQRRAGRSRSKAVALAWPGRAKAPPSRFTGRCTSLALAGPVQLELLQGQLSGGAEAQPHAHLALSGEAMAVLGLARALAADLALLPAPELSAQALALAGQAPLPAPQGAARITPGSTVEAALLEVMAHLLAVMRHQAPQCRADAGPEGVHQMRVALRRLRAALRNFRPALRSAELDAFDKALGALARRLGPARDWDVFGAGLGARLAAMLPGEKRLAPLLKAAEARRQAGYAALAEVLHGPAFRLLVLDGLALLALRPWRAQADAAALLDQPAATFGAALLAKRWRKLQQQGEDFASLDTEALHALRLSGKRLRYLAEIFAPLWPGKPARRWLRRLAAVQERLGLANDIAVARGLLAELRAGTPRAGAWAVGLAEGLAVAQLCDSRTEAEETWEKLRDTNPFWDRT